MQVDLPIKSKVNYPQGCCAGAALCRFINLKDRVRCGMSLCYKISPELNMILYIGKGYLTPSDFYSLEKAAFEKNHRPKGMITLVDVLEASTAFELDDIHYFVNNIHNMADNGLEPGPYVMLTNDWGIHLLAEAVRLLPSKVDLKIRMYNTLPEAIDRLGLSEQKQKIIQLWNECNIEGSSISDGSANVHTLRQVT